MPLPELCDIGEASRKYAGPIASVCEELCERVYAGLAQSRLEARDRPRQRPRLGRSDLFLLLGLRWSGPCSNFPEKATDRVTRPRPEVTVRHDVERHPDTTEMLRDLS